MYVRLTDKGREHLGKSADVLVVNVSTDRAFSMMEGGLALKDASFMARYEENEDNAEPVKPEEVKELAKEEPTAAEAEQKPDEKASEPKKSKPKKKKRGG